jgi:hypothetical protein
MPLTRKLKVLAALLLLLGFVLPLSSCVVTDRPEHENGPRKTHVEYHYAWSGIDAAEPASFIVPLFFLWPLAALVAARKPGRLARMSWWLEAALWGCSAYFIDLALLAVTRIEIGGYLACAGLVLHAGAWIGEAAVRWRSWRDARRPAAAGG